MPKKAKRSILKIKKTRKHTTRKSKTIGSSLFKTRKSATKRPRTTKRPLLSRRRSRKLAAKRLKRLPKPLKLTFAGASLAGVVILIGLATGLLSFLSVENKVAKAAGSQPNIVVLLTDDEPALDGRLINWLPTIKSMFKDQGATFSDFHASGNLCCPDRATYISGQFIHNHGVVENNFRPFNPSMSIATQLKTVGYHNILAGKYMNGYGKCEVGDPCPPGMPPGWDRFMALDDGEYYNYNMWLDGQIKEFHGTGAANYSTDVISTQADSLIRSAPQEQPLMAWIGVYAAHGPTTPAPRHKSVPCESTKWKPANYNEADVNDKPAYVRSAPRLGNPESLAKHCRTLKSADDLMVKVRKALSDTNRLDNTLFVYVGDNGMHMGEHRLTRKTAPYQSRVPFYISWPEVLGSSPRTISDRVAGVDLAPFLCEVAGCTLGPYPNGQQTPDGKSFLGLLLGSESSMGRDAVFQEMPIGGIGANNVLVPGWAGVTTTKDSPLASQGCFDAGNNGCRWQYVEYNTGEKELYDLSGGLCWTWKVGNPGDPCKLNNKASDPNYAPILLILQARTQELRNQRGI